MRRYDGVAVLLHWAIAAGVLAQLALGWWMVGLPDGEQRAWFNLHKSAGLTLGLLVLARIAWRLSHRPPSLPQSLAPWQRAAARASHAALYACLVVVPLAGYLGSSFSGYPIRFFGWALPAWGWKWPAAKALLSTLHQAAAWLLVALVLVHVCAALTHLARRDGVFARMLPHWRNA